LDFANLSNTDACLTTCKKSKCGDGFTQQGVEECDDANVVNTDVCLNTCKLAKCGDGVVQAGVEECDDANVVNTDACLSTCKAAKCGDGVVQAGVEQCDDGNVVNNDACSNVCKTPSCADAIKNGNESDIDCGGACAKCVVGKACGVGSDCSSSYCSANVCAVPPSCKAIKTALPAATSGVYTIDPDGGGPVVAFSAYCDMVTDGGGWTLAMKVDGTKGTFPYDAALWTNNTTYQPNFPDLDRNEAKLQTFDTVAFTDILIGFESPILVNGPLQLTTLKLTITRPSLLNLFQGAYVATALGRNAWKALIAGSSLQANCNREGFNANPVGGGNARARIGISSNQENDCNTPDSYLGIGTFGAPCGPAPERAAGNVAGCAPDNGDKNLPAFAVVYVR